MGVEVLDSSLESDDTVDEMLDNDDTEKPFKGETDARRRLEEKLEEMRLQRELQEYDFDF